MQAIILAAGIGRRLGKLTERIPKCMISINGKPIIESSLENIKRAGIKRVIVVVGHGKDILIDYIKEKFERDFEFTFIENPYYKETNNIYSLYLTKDYLEKEDTILLESDIIYEFSILKNLIEDSREVLAVVDKYKSWMDGTVVKVDEHDNIVAFIPKEFFDYKEVDEYYKTVNIYKFSRQFLKEIYIPFLRSYIEVFGKNEYYELVLRVISTLEKANIKALRLSGEKWYEIDTVQDIKNAECIFSESAEKKLVNISKRYGGYWRFPHIKDFCYLVNPYFPTEKMYAEMKTYLEDLVSQYPSTLDVQNSLASSIFGVSENHIIVGNGASELIKCLNLSGKTGIVCPTFNEYLENIENLVTFIPSNDDYSYGVEELYNLSKDVDNLIIVNPDNPSGNYINCTELRHLIETLHDKGKMIIVDESFIDFSDEGEEASLIKEDILIRYPNLIVIKSISKSYGVPGLRLGVLATSNEKVLDEIRSNIPVWNINSVAEFFLQIMNKYKNDYKMACVKIKEERKKFFKMLSGISYLRVIPSQANYFMCEVKGRLSAKDLAIKLIEKDVLIKILTGKFGIRGEYVRIAVRDSEDNYQLFEILKSLENG